MKYHHTYLPILTLATLLVINLPEHPPSTNSVEPSKQTVKQVSQVQEVPQKKLSKVQKQYLDTIIEEYYVDAKLVKEVLHHVDKYAHKVFPRREDLLAVIGIESSWNPDAVSPLKKDPAIGLTQIRPGAWKKFIADAEELLHVENQVKYAAKILNYNFRLTESKEDAIIAYNAGYGNWLNGKYSDDYLMKFLIERDKFRRS